MHDLRSTQTWAVGIRTPERCQETPHGACGAARHVPASALPGVLGLVRLCLTTDPHAGPIHSIADPLRLEVGLPVPEARPFCRTHPNTALLPVTCTWTSWGSAPPWRGLLCPPPAPTDVIPPVTLPTI